MRIKERKTQKKAERQRRKSVCNVSWESHHYTQHQLLSKVDLRWMELILQGIRIHS